MITDYYSWEDGAPFFAYHWAPGALDENYSLKFNGTFAVSFAGIVPS